jgi:hypothetical protein
VLILRAFFTACPIILFVVGVAVWAAWVVHFPLTDTDIWWHLAAGRAMSEGQAWLRSDIFSRISYGVPWIDLHWGFQVLTYRIWLLGGESALAAAKSAASALLALLCWAPLPFETWRALRSRQVAGMGSPESLGAEAAPISFGSFRPILALAFALPFAWTLTYHQRYLTDVRPLWLTLILLTVQAIALREWLRLRVSKPARIPDKDSRTRVGCLVALIGLAQIALANVQGLHMLGPLLMGLLALGELWRLHSLHLPTQPLVFSELKRIVTRVALLVASLTALSLINPYGWQAFTLAAKVAGRIAPVAGNVFSHDMAENAPLWVAWHENPSLVQPMVAAWAVGLTFAVLASFSRRHRFHGEMLVHMVCIALALAALRNAPLALMSLAWWLARILAIAEAPHIPHMPGLKSLPVLPRHFASPHLTTWPRFAVLASTVALAILYAWFIPTAIHQVREVRAAQAYELPGTSVTPFRLPIGAADYLARHPIPGQLFNELRHGGYLAWRFADPAKNFIDGRMVLRTAEQYREVMGAFDRPESFSTLQARYGITHVLLPLMEWDRYRPLGHHLLRNGSMRLVYCDGASALLASPGPNGTPNLTWPEIEKEVTLRFSSNPRLQEMAMQSAKAFWAAIL